MVGTNNRMWVNDKEVAAKVIDGEAIIINLSNGMYYSLDKSGASAWSLLSAGHTVTESAAVLAERYGVPPQQVQQDLEKLAADLVEHRLVLPANGHGSSAPQQVELEPVNGDGYETPTLNAYNDMGDVLALDPPLPQLEEEPWSDEEPVSR